MCTSHRKKQCRAGYACLLVHLGTVIDRQVPTGREWRKTSKTRSTRWLDPQVHAKTRTSHQKLSKVPQWEPPSDAKRNTKRRRRFVSQAKTRRSVNIRKRAPPVISYRRGFQIRIECRLGRTPRTNCKHRRVGTSHIGPSTRDELATTCKVFELLSNATFRPRWKCVSVATSHQIKW